MNENLQSLKKWHKLLQDGIISQDEFDKKKKELLGITSEAFDNKLPQEMVAIEKQEFQSIPGQNLKTLSTAAVKTKNDVLNANQIFVIASGLLILTGTLWFWSKGTEERNIVSEQILSDSTALVSDMNERFTESTSLIADSLRILSLDNHEDEYDRKEVSESNSSFQINKKVDYVAEHCYHDPCTVGKTLSVDISDQTSTETTLNVQVLGGEKGWDSEKITWNEMPHNIIIKCSKTKPSVTVGLQTDILPLNYQYGVPGVLVSTAETYFQYCHSSDLPLDVAVNKFNYNLKE